MNGSFGTVEPGLLTALGQKELRHGCLGKGREGKVARWAGDPSPHGNSSTCVLFTHVCLVGVRGSRADRGPLLCGFSTFTSPSSYLAHAGAVFGGGHTPQVLLHHPRCSALWPARGRPSHRDVPRPLPAGALKGVLTAKCVP